MALLYLLSEAERLAEVKRFYGKTLREFLDSAVYKNYGDITETTEAYRERNGSTSTQAIKSISVSPHGGLSERLVDPKNDPISLSYMPTRASYLNRIFTRFLISRFKHTYEVWTAYKHLYHYLSFRATHCRYFRGKEWYSAKNAASLLDPVTLKKARLIFGQHADSKMYAAVCEFWELIPFFEKNAPRLFEGFTYCSTTLENYFANLTPIDKAFANVSVLKYKAMRAIRYRLRYFCKEEAEAVANLPLSFLKVFVKLAYRVDNSEYYALLIPPLAELAKTKRGKYRLLRKRLEKGLIKQELQQQKISTYSSLINVISSISSIGNSI